MRHPVDDHSMAGSPERLHNNALKLLETENICTKETWFLAESCLNQLSAGSDIASFQLFVKLYDRMLMKERPKLHQTSSLGDFLINRDMVTRSVLQWQQLHRSQTQDVTKLMAPSRLLDYLHAWTQYIPGTHLASNAVLSWILDATSRRAKLLNLNHRQRTEVAQFATNLLSRMWQNEHDPIRPSPVNVNVVITLWRHEPSKALEVLRANLQTVNVQSYHHLIPAFRAPVAERIVKDEMEVKPDITCWNLVLGAYVKASNRQLAAERVQHIMVNIMTDPDLEPDVVTFNTALTAWARVGWADQCAKVFEDMKEAYANGTLNSPPDVYTYASVINAYAQAGQPEQAERVSDELYQQFMSSDSQVDLKPSIETFTSILNAYSKSIGKAVADSSRNATVWSLLSSAQRTWRRMFELHQFGLLAESPDVAAYNAYLSCYQKAASVVTAPAVNSSADQADRLFEEIKADPTLRPDFTTYSITIQTWLHRSNGLKRAMHILDEAWNDPNVSMDSSSLHHIVTSICRRARPDIGQSLLLRICEAREKTPERVEEPRKASFGAVLGAWMKQKGPFAANKAHKLVKELHSYRKRETVSLEPDQPMYAALVSIWSNSQASGSAHHAYAYLSRMRELARTDVKMRPTRSSFHHVLSACGRGEVNPFMAEMVLKQLRDDYENSGGQDSLQPTAETFNMVLNAWARYDHPDAVRKAEALFSEVQRLHSTGEYDCCDGVTYNIMLNCYANSGRREDAETAERLIEGLQRVSTAGANAHGSMIKAWAKAGDPQKAHDALFNLCRRYRAGDEQLKPQSRHFNTVLQAWSEKPHENSEQRIKDVLEEKESILG